jgi:hypothetical protein
MATIETKTGDKFFFDATHSPFIPVLDYENKDKGGWQIAFESPTGKFTLEPKKQGTAIQLFAALEYLTKKFIQKYKPEIIYYVGVHEKSRQKLFDTIAKRISKLGYNSAGKFKGKTGNYWILEKKL